MDDVAPVTAWYGKSPSTGDFVSRRLSKSTIDTLHLWVGTGMAALRERAPDDWPIHYASAPVWNALLPAGIVSAQPHIAIIASSFDRVGRRFPMCVLVALAHGSATLARIVSLPDYCAALARLVGQSIRTSIGADELDRRLATLTAEQFRAEPAPADALSDIVEVLGNAALENEQTTVPLNVDSAFPWPNLTREFDPTTPTSYWWSAARPGRLQSGFTHSGPLDATLFVALFGEAQPDTSARASGNDSAAHGGRS